MKTTIQATAQELLTRKDYSEVIKAALQLIVDGQMSSLALYKVLVENDMSNITDIKDQCLGVILDYADIILEDNILTPDELKNLKMLKLFFHVEEGDFQNNNKSARVESIIIRQLEKLYADNILDEQEALHQSDLQGVFGLGYDEYETIVNKVAK